MFEIGWLDDDERDEGEFDAKKAHWQLEWLCMCVL